ncbi:MAG: hypothetical protein ACFFA0_02880 [Promethearchaeota archaeon]
MMSNSNEKELISFLENVVIKNSKKVKGRKTPIAEIVDNNLIALSVKSIYDMSEKIKHFYLILVKNQSKQPKFRYFLAISLANNSSDLLVQLAKEFAIKNNLKLIQYSIYPKTLRLQLLSLKEIKGVKDYNNSVEILKAFRKVFREKLLGIRKLVENK